MRFDPIDRRYEDDNGRPIPPATIRKEIDEWVKVEQKEVEREATKLLAGAITVAALFDFLADKIRAWHSIAGVIAYGGEAQMNPERWARVNEKIQSEIQYLENFQQEALASFEAAERIAQEVAREVDAPSGLESVIEERVAEALRDAAPSTALAVAAGIAAAVIADSIGTKPEIVLPESIDTQGLIGGTISARAQQYPNAFYGTYENNVAAREWDYGAIGVRRASLDDESSCEECPELASEEYVSFDEIRDIGDSICGSRCRCWLEFSYPTAIGAVEPIEIERGIYA